MLGGSFNQPARMASVEQLAHPLNVLQQRWIADRAEEGVGVELEPHLACSNSLAISGLAASVESGSVN